MHPERPENRKVLSLKMFRLNQIASYLLQLHQADRMLTSTAAQAASIGQPIDAQPVAILAPIRKGDIMTVHSLRCAVILPLTSDQRALHLHCGTSSSVSWESVLIRVDAKSTALPDTAIA